MSLTCSGSQNGYLSGPISSDFSYRHSYENPSIKAIKGACENLSGRALILASGTCREIPLGYLAEQFDRIDIVGKNLTPAEKALEKLTQGGKEKFSLIEADLSGIYDDFVTEVEKYAKNSHHYEDFINKISHYVQSHTPLSYNYQPTESPSFVCSSLVSTQIPANFVEHLIEASRTNFNTNFEIPERDRTAFKSWLDTMLFQHIQDLSNWVSPNGKIYYSDIFWVRKAQERISKVRENESKYLSSTTYVPEQKLQRYLLGRFAIKEYKIWDINREVARESSTFTDDNQTRYVEQLITYQISRVSAFSLSLESKKRF